MFFTEGEVEQILASQLCWAHRKVFHDYFEGSLQNWKYFVLFVSFVGR